MSFAGQVLWNLHTIGACDLAIIGKPSAAPPATTPLAAFRNLRRVPADERDLACAGVSDLRIMIPPKMNGVFAPNPAIVVPRVSVRPPQRATRPSGRRRLPRSVYPLLPHRPHRALAAAPGGEAPPPLSNCDVCRSRVGGRR